MLKFKMLYKYKMNLDFLGKKFDRLVIEIIFSVFFWENKL